MKPNNPEPCEQAEVIFEKPLSGEFEEVLFGSDRGNTLWVKFSDKDGAGEWIGKFGVGSGGSGHVVKFAEPDQFVVSAGNFAYMVNATRRQLVGQYHSAGALEIIYDPVRKCFIAANYTDLTWVGLNGEILFSRKVSVDGICGLKIKGGLLFGRAFKDYDGVEGQFVFDLESLKILSWNNN